MIGIIGAMEEEITLLCEKMKKFTTEKMGGCEFYTGMIEEKDVTVLRCGIGKVNAAIGCTLLIHKFKVSCVIHSGAAGGIKPDLKMGDAIISTGLIYHDVDVTAFMYKLGQLPGGLPLIYPANEHLVEIAEEAVEELKKDNVLPKTFVCHRGIIGTGDVFVHDDKQIERIRKAFPDITAVEMEGAAVAQCCYLFSIPSLVIRAVSDVADVESPVSFKEYLPIAAEHSAGIVIKTLRLM